MTRLLLLLLINAPLLAVSPGDGSPLALTDARVSIDLSSDHARVTCRATLHNPGEEPHEARLTLPRELIPADQRDGFTLKVAGVERESDDTRQPRWKVRFEPDKKLEVSWVVTLTPSDLPHAHPQGRRAVRVTLSHMRGYSALPENCTFVVTAPDMPPELFGREQGDTTTIEREVEAHMEDFLYEWYKHTRQGKVDALVNVRDAFSEAQRNGRNRSYTETLVHLADLYYLGDDHDALAETCEVLEKLEADTGRAITHCGPWARWRKHVPWQLRRMRALKAAGKDATAAAREAEAAMAVLWPAYNAARGKARPFDHFDFDKHGSFRDYDWAATRELYAQALEVLGKADDAKSVREAE